jgi:precorrin-6B methylase 2
MQHYKKHGYETTMNPNFDPERANTIAQYSRFGMRFLLDSSEMTDREVIETGTWEPEQLAHFDRLIECFRRRDAAFLDIGAGWGLFSMLAFNAQVFSTIYAFEPDARQFGQLHAQTLLNGAVDAIEVRNTLAIAEALPSLSGKYLLIRIGLTENEDTTLHDLDQIVKNNKVAIQMQVFKPDHEKIFAEINRMGLRTVHTSYPHCCFTNMATHEFHI